MPPKPKSKILLALDSLDSTKSGEKKGSPVAETGKAPRLYPLSFPPVPRRTC